MAGAGAALLAATAGLPAGRALARDQWDLIVVGGGTAGLPTALFAAARARVLVIEKAPLLGGTQLQITRGGWSNPAGQPRSSLRRIGYQLEEQELVRYAWAVLDRAQNSEPVEQSLLDNVTEMQLRYLGADAEWQDSWPPVAGSVAGATVILPLAVSRCQLVSSQVAPALIFAASQALSGW